MIRTTIQAYRAAFAGLPADAWLLSGVLAVNRAGSMVLPFLGLYLTREQGLTLSRAGILLGVYGIGSIAGSWIGGWLADRIGSTRTLHASLLTSGAGLLVLSRLSEFWALGVAVLAVSIPLEAFRPAVMADMARRAPPALEVRCFALLRLAANLGVGIAPAVGGFLALRSYGWLFLADAATCWIASAVLAWAGEPAPATVAIPDGVGTAPAIGRPARPDRSPWRDGPYLLLLALVVGLAAVFLQTLSTLPLYLNRSCGYREDVIGLLLALNPFLIVAFEMVLVHWAEQRDRLALVGLGGFLICLGFALLPLGTSLGWIALSIVVWTIGEMLALPLTNALVAARSGPRHRGRYMGMYTMAFATAFVFAPTTGTWVYEHFGAAALWFGIGALGPLLWVAALALRPAFRD